MLTAFASNGENHEGLMVLQMLVYFARRRERGCSSGMSSVIGVGIAAAAEIELTLAPPRVDV